MTDQIDIGVGSYGLVTFGRYSTDGKQSRDVVIKIPRDITGYEKELAKEGKLFNSVNGHPNIVSFEAVSVSPFAIFVIPQLTLLENYLLIFFLSELNSISGSIWQYNMKLGKPKIRY